MTILSICPLCKGKGKIHKPLPPGANPRAPATRADKLGMITCPKCKGAGRIGVG